MSVRKQINLTIFIISIALIAWAVALLIPKFKADTLTDYSLEQAAHTVLTDGTKATANPDDPNWLTLYADSSTLPKTSYAGKQFGFWGVTSPYSANPNRTPGVYSLLNEANIKSVRQEMPWNGLQQYVKADGSIDFNWSGTEDIVNAYVNDGASVMGLLSYTPPWASGHRPRIAPPSRVVESEAMDLSLGSGQVAQRPLVHDPIVIPADSTVARVTHEVLTTNYNNQAVMNTTKSPIIPESIVLEVNEKDTGWQAWTLVPSIMPESPKGATHFMADFRGRIMFANSGYYDNHARAPLIDPSPSPIPTQIRISYDYYESVYSHGVDYTYNHVNGIFNRQGGDLSLLKNEDNFTASTLDPAWQWMDEPSSWDVNTTVPNKLHVTMPYYSDWSDRGSFMYQQSSGSGDFIMHTKIDQRNWQPNCDLTLPFFSPGGCDSNPVKRWSYTQSGPMVYQDENNWVRIAISNAGGTLSGQNVMVVQNINGIKNKYHTASWFNITTPKWFSIRKSADKLYFYFGDSAQATNPSSYQINNFMTGELKYGISFLGNGHPNNGIETTAIDEIKILTPAINDNPQVKIFYEYLDLDVWKNYVYKTVNHFKDRVKYWEIWNEPDQGWCWSGSYEQMAYMLKGAYEAVKLADPDAVVVGPAFSNAEAARNGYNVIYDLFGGQYMDHLSFHPYHFSNLPPDHTWYGTPVFRTRMIDEGDIQKKVFMTEISTTSGVTASNGGMNERKQVDFGIRVGMFARKLGWAASLHWWPTIDQRLVGTDEEFKFGGHDGLFYLQQSKATLATRSNNIVTIHTENPHYYQPGDTIYFELFKNAFGTANRTVLSVPTATTFTFEMAGADSDSLWIQEKTINGLYPKPMYWGYRNLAQNRGVILDLVSYDTGHNPVPASRKYGINKVKVSTLRREDIQSIKVLSSMTATHESSRPRRVAARGVGQTSGQSPFVVSIDHASNQLKSERWLVTATSQTQFSVVGDLSGNQGTATVGQSFESNNGLLTFTIPQSAGDPYSVGHGFEFESFAGDGFSELTTWQNHAALEGRGDIEIDLPANSEARYLALHFVKADGVTEIKLDEIEVLETSSAQNIANAKTYLVDGYQEYFKEVIEPEDKPVIEIVSPQSGDTVTTETVFVTYRVDGTTKSQQFSLVSGENTLEITEENAFGTTTVNLTIFYALAPVLTIPGDLQNKVVNSADLVVDYLHDGQSKSANFNLNRGRNDLSISESNFGLQTTKTFSVYYVAGDRTLPKERFVTGINMVAFPFVKEASFSDIFSTPTYSPLRRNDPTDGKLKSKILAYDGTTPYKRFAPNPSAGDEANLVPTLGLGYFVRIFADESFDNIKYIGEDVNNVSVNLVGGWNLLGNPFDQGMSPSNFSFNHNGQVKSYSQAVNEKLIEDYFYTWERALQAYKFISVNNRYDNQVNRQSEIDPYRGFWLYAKVNGLTIVMNK